MAATIKTKHNGKKVPLTAPKPVTANYKPFDYKRWFQQPRDLPPFTFATILAMQIDPTIRLGLAMRAAPLYGAEFAYKEGDKWTPGVKCDDPIVGAFVLRQLERIWNHLDGLLEAQKWGWSACEVQYCLTQHGTVEIERLLPRHPNDTRALSRDGEVVGVRFLKIQHEHKGYADLPFPKCIFHAHAPEPGCEYGSSILNGSYSPWADKWLNGGALDVRRLFMHKDAYGGVDIGYPPGTTNIDGKGEVPNRDIAREMAEQIEAGAVTARPTAYDPISGNEYWPLTRASIPANPQHILQYPKDLDAEELRGMEIPDEVFISSDTDTTGYSGKSIPMQGFYTGLDRWLTKLLMDLRRQVLVPLVALNHGPGRFFEVGAKPLGLQAMEQQGEGKSDNGGPKPNPFMMQGEFQGGGSGEGQQPQRMSLEQSVGDGLVNAADLVAAVRAILDKRIAA